VRVRVRVCVCIFRTDILTFTNTQILRGEWQ